MRNSQLFVAGLVLLAGMPNAVAEFRQQSPYTLVGAISAAAHTDRCREGFVWREAFPSDHVCVTPQTRSQAAADNAAAAARRAPAGGDTCSQGYVWRMAHSADHVCVDKKTWEETQKDNSAALLRLASPVLKRPDTPSRRARIPFPPLTLGCHHLVGRQWQEVPCATQEQMRKLPKLGMPVPSIEAEIENIPGAPPLITPLVWGSVTSGIVSDPTQATEVDTMLGANAFSIQANTNHFPCSTCSANYPVQGSNAGDIGWVQFVVQGHPSDNKTAPGTEGVVCIQQWDITVGDYSKTFCLSLLNGHRGVLTGKNAFIGFTEVIGYFPQSPCPANYTGGFVANPPPCLHLLAYVPWAGEGEGPVGTNIVEMGSWYHIAAPDWYGLSVNGNWTLLSGTIYGYDQGSRANFTNAQVETVLRAYSCFDQPQDPTGYFAVPCGNTFLDPGISIVATQIPIGITAETNNLPMPPDPAFACQLSECWLYYTASAQ